VAATRSAEMTFAPVVGRPIELAVKIRPAICWHDWPANGANAGSAAGCAMGSADCSLHATSKELAKPHRN
jgi:hypothetical protein